MRETYCLERLETSEIEGVGDVFKNFSTERATGKLLALSKYTALECKQR